MGLKAGIWASRLEFESQNEDLSGGQREKREEEKIPNMYESTDHPLGPLPDHLTLLRLLTLLL